MAVSGAVSDAILGPRSQIKQIHVFHLSNSVMEYIPILDTHGFDPGNRFRTPSKPAARGPPMDTESLKAFIAVAQTRSFSQAAQQLHLTQPAVSKRVAGLESQLGARLFDRIGRTVGLTEAGQRLLPRARGILHEIAETARELRDQGGAISGRLALGTSHHVGLHRLPPLLREFARHHPAVTLEIEFMDSEKAHEAVQQGSLELAVITLAPAGSAPRLHSRRVWHDPLSVMVARDHPLAGHARVDTATLARHPAVLPGGGTYTGQILQALFATRGERLRIAMSSNYLETLRMLVAIGLGWSVLPDTMLTPELVRIELEGARLARELGYVWHRERTLSNAARAFVALLDEHAAAAPPPPP
jgi:DNA-binding transcriptional LysR family regulator